MERATRSEGSIVVAKVRCRSAAYSRVSREFSSSLEPILADSRDQPRRREFFRVPARPVAAASRPESQFRVWVSRKCAPVAESVRASVEVTRCGAGTDRSRVNASYNSASFLARTSWFVRLNCTVDFPQFSYGILVQRRIFGIS